VKIEEQKKTLKAYAREEVETFCDMLDCVDHPVGLTSKTTTMKGKFKVVVEVSAHIEEIT